MKKLKYDPLNIVVCGIGGQGNVLASELVASTMNDLGYKVAVGETYGAAQRGGSVMSHIRISAKEETGVLIPSGEAHIILAFEPLEALRTARQYSGKKTFIVYDPRPVYPQSVLKGEANYPGIKEIEKELKSLAQEIIAVPAADIALEIGNPKAANIVLLGAFSKLPAAPLKSDELEEVLKQRFSGEALKLNLLAFSKGCEAGSKEAK